MRIKNIMNDVRQFADIGKIIYVQPKDTVECSDKSRYDDRVFKKVQIKKSKESEEKPNNKKEVR